MFSLGLIGLRRASLISFPAFVDRILGYDIQENYDYSEKGYEIFEYIRDTTFPDAQRVYPEISLHSLNSILSNLDTYKNFYWESSSETFSGASSILYHCKSRVSGNKYNTEILDRHENIVKSYICDGTNTSITAQNGGFVERKVVSSGIFDFYSDAQIISVASIKDLDFSDDNSEIYQISKDEYNLISIKHNYNRGETQITDNYMISLDFGVVMFAECFENDALVYRFSTNTIYPLTSLDNDLFEIN